MKIINVGSLQGLRALTIEILNKNPGYTVLEEPTVSLFPATLIAVADPKIKTLTFHKVDSVHTVP